LEKCVVCKRKIPIGHVRAMYKKDNGKIVHFHIGCEKEFDEKKIEK
jgi:hypothetical protein